MWPGTIHGLQAVFRVVELHAGEHVFGVVAQVAGGSPQIRAHNVRRVDQIVAARQVLVAHPVFDDLAHARALGVEEDEPGAGEFLNAEEVELLSQLAVVTLLGLF